MAVKKPAADYIKLVNNAGDAVDTISWIDGRTTYYARLGINGTIIYGTSLDDTSSLIYMAANNTKSNTFKMTCDYMLYGIKGTDDDGNIVDIPEFLTLKNSKLTIDGKGYSIKTNNELLGFVVPEPQPKKSITLNIKNVANIQGFNGALINKGGKISVSGTGFSKNESDTYGSVARNEKGTLSISGSSKSHAVIRNNTSNQYAGAIYNAGTLTTKYVDFGGTTSATQGSFSNISEIGGAVYNIGKATFTSTKFIENIAGLTGGAVYSKGIVSSSSSQYEKNMALSGGAIYSAVEDGITSGLTISKSTFTSNVAKSDEPIADAFGGAVYTETYLTDSSSTYNANSAVGTDTINGSGGAVYINTVADEKNKLTNKFTSTKFYNNSASDMGGAVYVKTRDFTTVADNTRTKVAFNKATFGSVDSTNGGNKATQGGAIYNENGNVTISSSNFIANSASESGGALFNDVNALTTISKGSFGYSDKKGLTVVGNSALYGGAIYNYGTLNATSVTFNGNTAVQGGALYSAIDQTGTVDAKVTLSKDTFKYNSVQVKSGLDEEALGGAIYNAADMSIASSTFTGNYTKDGKGGAIYNSADSKSLELTKVTFTGNYALYGNAIYNDGTINKISSTFKSNVMNNPNAQGGAIYNNALIDSIESSTFTNNQSTYGGAIYNSANGTINRLYKVTAGNAKSNKSQNIAKYGGAIYNAGTISEISSSTLSRNNATASGAAIYNTGIISKITSTAMSNEVSATNGGAIYNAGTIESIDRKSTISNNKSTNGNGGAIYNNGDENNGAVMTLVGATISGNTAGSNGGAIYNGKYGSMYFTTAIEGNKSYYATFKSNTSAITGGAVFNAGEMTFESVTFTSNKTTSATGGGGAIYNAGNLTIADSSVFTSNTAYNGGAIYNASTGSIELNKVTFGNAKNLLTKQVKTVVQSTMLVL